MPKDLKDFPRPPSDNGRGLHGSASPGWSGAGEGYDFWIGELISMGIRWVKVVDSAGDSPEFCERLIAAGIFPIARILRRDPPPNDAPEPNPGHLNSTEEETIRRLVALGVRYFETNSEPDVPSEWKNGAIPGDPIETAKLVALNWLFDARFILAAGGLPGLPAISSGGSMDLMGALVSLGRQDILLEGCWIALHNYSKNLPIDYPDDPVNRNGVPLTTAQYDLGPFALWAWWNSAIGRADTLDEVNSMRNAGKNPDETVQRDHACFREFEYYNALAMKYLGRSIPIISTECGYSIGRREDGRYPRVTPDAHRDYTVAMFDYMQRQAPDYYFAAMPWLMPENQGMEMDAWYSSFWKRTLQSSSTTRDGIPPIAVTGVALSDRLPVVEAVKRMPNLARRMPGVQPAPPPVQVTTAPQPTRNLPLKYVVVGGDTIAKIAKQFGTAVTEIVALNRLPSPDSIQSGQVLLIPRAGETTETDTAKPESASRPARAEAGLAALFPEPEAPAPAPAPSAQVSPVPAEAPSAPAPLPTLELPPAPRPAPEVRPAAPPTAVSPQPSIPAPSTASPQPAAPAVRPPPGPAPSTTSPQPAAPAVQPSPGPAPSTASPQPAAPAVQPSPRPAPSTISRQPAAPAVKPSPRPAPSTTSPQPAAPAVEPSSRPAAPSAPPPRVAPSTPESPKRSIRPAPSAPSTGAPQPARPAVQPSSKPAAPSAPPPRPATATPTTKKPSTSPAPRLAPKAPRPSAPTPPTYPRPVAPQASAPRQTPPPPPEVGTSRPAPPPPETRFTPPTQPRPSTPLPPPPSQTASTTPRPARSEPAPLPPLAAPPKLPDENAVPMELEWDWRLDALGIAIDEAHVSPGEEYWKLVRADYQGPDEAGDNHHIFYHVLDQRGQPVAGQRVWQGWPNDKTDAATNEQGEAGIPLWTSFAPDQGEGGSYIAWVDSLPSDRVYGMGLPLKRRVNFFLTWQRVVKRF